LERPWITGINFQPATYSGRFAIPGQLERRVTFPDVIRGIVSQTDGLFAEEDFLPLPCAHPNCHSLAYAYRRGDEVLPLTRFIDARNHIDLLANGIAFTRPQARQVITQYLQRLGCCAGQCGASSDDGVEQQLPVLNLSLPTAIASSKDRATPEPNSRALAAAQTFFRQVLAEQIGASDIFRITITSFLDAFNFDVRRLMKCCTHHVLPSGHVIPFCAYNVLYRDGHVPLPALQIAASAYRGT
jgi:uncharacterized radical SAM superfamily Fe-S cluster-containing enzyme